MRPLTMLPAALMALAGCASNPTPLPDWDLGARTPSEIAEPLDLPLLCKIPWAHDDCWKAIEAYEVVAERNRKNAINNNTALRATESAYDAIISAGRAQQQYAVIKQQQLDRCVSDANSDKWMYRAVIVGITALAVTQ